MIDLSWPDIAYKVITLVITLAVGYQVKRVEHTFNSKMDSYVKLVGDAKYAEGVLAEKVRAAAERGVVSQAIAESVAESGRQP